MSMPRGRRETTRDPTISGSPVGSRGYPPARGRAAGGEGGLEADEVVDIEDGRRGGTVAVGVGGSGGEGGLEAHEVVDVEERHRRGLVAVGVAGNGAGGVPEADRGRQDRRV